MCLCTTTSDVFYIYQSKANKKLLLLAPHLMILFEFMFTHSVQMPVICPDGVWSARPMRPREYPQK